MTGARQNLPLKSAWPFNRLGESLASGANFPYIDTSYIDWHHDKINPEGWKRGRHTVTFSSQAAARYTLKSPRYFEASLTLR